MADKQYLDYTGLKRYNDNMKGYIAGEISSAVATELYTPITCTKLRKLVSNGALVPGMWYRLTDYAFLVNSGEAVTSRSTDTPFDLLILAISSTTLCEECLVTHHDGDTYFANNDLGKWRVWYELKNADCAWLPLESGGRGAIYRMIDEFGNDLPYDFKNAMFVPLGGSSACLTFGETSDLSLLGPANGGAYENKVKPHIKQSNGQRLFPNVHFSGPAHHNEVGGNCNVAEIKGEHNKIGNECITVQIEGESSSYNTIGDRCFNIYINGDENEFNEIGDGCGAIWLYGSNSDNKIENGCNRIYLPEGTSDCVIGVGCKDLDATQITAGVTYMVVDPGCMYLTLIPGDSSSTATYGYMHIYLGTCGDSSANPREVAIYGGYADD